MRRRLTQLLERLDVNLRLLEAYLIVKDPTAPKSAEAFDTLRSRIDSLYKQRRRYQAMLSDLHRTCLLTLASRNDALLAKLEEYLRLDGIQITYDFQGQAEAFAVVGDITADMRVVSPAYLASHDGQTLELIRQGVAEAEKQQQATSAESTQRGDSPTQGDNGPTGTVSCSDESAQSHPFDTPDKEPP